MAAGDTATAERRDRAGKTLAQTFCLVAGITLVAVGILGFFVNSSFSTGAGVEGDNLIVFEVNGWHNIVHIATGALLLFASPKGPLAATVATVFGAVYAIVTIWGLLDGNDVLGLVPVNAADNVLHIALTVAALFVGLTSGGLMASSRAGSGRATT